MNAERGGGEGAGSGRGGSGGSRSGRDEPRKARWSGKRDGPAGSVRGAGDSSANTVRGGSARGAGGPARPDTGGRRVAEGASARSAHAGGAGGSVRLRSKEARTIAPEIAEGVSGVDLDRAARARLRTLSKDNAEGVACHLVMAGRLLEDNPEVAYEHAREAVRRAGRIDVVREAAGITAYRTGRYAEALRELRTARRLNDSDEHVPLMADCERGLGRPERALALAAEHAEMLSAEGRIELAIVVSGARLDLGEPEAAVAVLRSPAANAATGPVAWRVAEALATALSACGREEEARVILEGVPSEAFETGEEDVIVIDLEDADTAETEAMNGES